MPSKLVTRRMQSAALVSQAFLTNRQAAGAKLASRFAPYLREGETMPDWSVVLGLLARELEHHAQAAERADDMHLNESAKEKGPQAAREETVESIRSRLIEIRQAVTALFGSAMLVTLQLPSEISSDPRAVARTAREFLAALAHTKLPMPQLPGVTSFAPAPWRNALEDYVAKLERALTDMAREAREAQETLNAKTEAIARYDDVFARVVAAGTALLRLAGEDGLAARLRPSTRRAGVLEAEEEAGG